ncbi:hypothetical protein [Caloramator mitchellensis]|nr:hypothetical protein [Caloramator mitchellensis]
MKTKGFILIQTVIFIILFSILALSILTVNFSNATSNQRMKLKDYELDICRSIVEFYKADEGKVYSNIEIYFDDFENIKKGIISNGLSNFVICANDNKNTKGQYKLNIEFSKIEGLNSIKVVCSNTVFNIKTSIIYYK